MKDGKKKQFDERRYKTAGTREGNEEQKTNNRPWCDVTKTLGNFLFLII